MNGVKTCSISRNIFQGTLPESGLQAMRAMRRFYMDSNYLEGTLPNRAVRWVRCFGVSVNWFQGKIEPDVNTMSQYINTKLFVLVSIALSLIINFPSCSSSVKSELSK
eukprot:1644629-Amphidinium_carterae.1